MFLEFFLIHVYFSYISCIFCTSFVRLADAIIESCIADIVGEMKATVQESFEQIYQNP